MTWRMAAKPKVGSIRSGVWKERLRFCSSWRLEDHRGALSETPLLVGVRDTAPIRVTESGLSEIRGISDRIALTSASETRNQSALGGERIVMGTGCGMSGVSCISIWIVSLRLAAARRRMDARNWRRSGPAGRGSVGRCANWANPRTSCNNFSILILVAMRSLDQPAASHVP